MAPLQGVSVVGTSSHILVSLRRAKYADNAQQGLSPHGDTRAVLNDTPQCARPNVWPKELQACR